MIFSLNFHSIFLKIDVVENIYMEYLSVIFCISLCLVAENSHF